MMAREIGTTRCSRLGLTTFRPSTAVAEEQASAEDTEDDQRAGVHDLAALDEGGQGHDAAVTAVVGAHDEACVLDRDDDHERPEDERSRAVDALGGGRRGLRVLREDGLDRVQGARADVAVDDAEGAEREHGLAGVRDDVAVPV
jgi:hypothetical protein